MGLAFLNTYLLKINASRFLPHEYTAALL